MYKTPIANACKKIDFLTLLGSGFLFEDYNNYNYLQLPEVVADADHKFQLLLLALQQRL